jgi:hypothetical protein
MRIKFVDIILIIVVCELSAQRQEQLLAVVQYLCSRSFLCLLCNSKKPMVMFQVVNDSKGEFMENQNQEGRK